jgi:hypothetical protein
MSSIIKDQKNIPASISLLHEQEYNNLCILFKIIQNKSQKRRAYSEKSLNKYNKLGESILFKSNIDVYSSSLKY